ncbi:hypothetical protein E8E13_008498 [Curvularia kusanoi]|uniref:Dienelactone hydrolase domain-containing protein n=1 Tax=Curvularia kusanoi TaxID=90978 RepID=A0A9P4THC4_CURKU|nr:hypothetical protein E8E13_008498 [Curvularia kusanoi]
MPSLWSKLIICALVGVTAAHTSPSKSCNITQIEGCSATGSIKNVGGIDIYHAYPRKHHSKHGSKNDTNNSSTAILFITDFYGLPSINNRLLADNLALATVPVIMPDLFSGDAVPMAMREGPALNLTDWRARHPTYEIDQVVEQTIEYMKSSLGVRRIGAVGYCLGGKHVPRFMAAGKGIERGFIAHPANLTAEEISAVVGPISVAAGELDNLFNKTNRREAEDILQAKNTTYQCPGAGVCEAGVV